MQGYFVLVTLCLLAGGGIVYQLFMQEGGGGIIFIFLSSNNIFVLSYIISSVPLIMLARYRVLSNLIACLILELLVLAVIWLLKRKRTWNRNISLKITKNEALYILAGCIVFTFLHVGSEEISSYGDMGAYFQHMILMLKGEYGSRLILKEIYTLSEVVDTHLHEMMTGGVFSVLENNIYQLHGIGTWCVVPALFAKIFGLYNSMYGVKYLFLLSYFNILYSTEKRVLNRLSIWIPILMVGTAPLMLYIGKTNLSEIAVFFLMSNGLLWLFKYSDSVWSYVLAGISLGGISFVHVNGFIYIPIFMLTFFLAGLLIESHSFRFLLVNSIMGIMLVFSMWYAYIIAPRYTVAQYGVISGRLRLSTVQTFWLLDVIILAGIILQFITFKKCRMPFINKVKSICKYYKIIFILGVGIIIGFTIYYGYFLCFSSRFFVDEEAYAASTWKIRNTYANTGIGAISYLNLTNILRATGISGGIIFLAIPFFKEKMALNLRLLYFTTILIMMIFTIYMWDTPINYYASRYFAPVLLPLIIITLTLTLENRRLILLLLMCVWIFNKRYIPSMLTCATHQGQYEILSDALTNIEGQAIIMFDTNSNTLPEALMSDLRILNDNNCYSLEDYEEVMAAYAGRKYIYIISKSELPNIEDMAELIFSRTYTSQYSLGHGENGTYGDISGTYEINMNIYQIRPDS